ncbi:hypothetical protein EOPP23_14070 [Endozoicomonas sp. OPT23]|uniref:STAS domain-containing protein n=1 Tax=Endozoicomonas sp. OPT23 TaxID=2072845 RepID=UPI00129BAC14|nr:STAS domain-containing protein [Endozoicomonas sp. OPT23]MRI34118.1 hypothetical protein [Endozoicomonas sp. OPT23]
MSLERMDSGRYLLKGAVNFENAAQVEVEGKQLMASDLKQEETIRIDLSDLHKGDSATLSLCLSWIREAHQHNTSLCFSSVPDELASLAKVCGLESVLQDSSCPV